MQEASLRRVSEVFELPGSTPNLVAGGRASFVYEFPDDVRPLILRAIRNDDDRYDLTLAETDFVKYLVDHGVSASEPIASRGGALAELVEIEEGEFVVAVFRRAAGKAVSVEEWTPPIWEALGEELGAIHRLTRDYRPPAGVRRPHWHEASIMDIDRYIPEEQEVLRRKAHELVAQLKELPTDRESYGLIHSDPGRGNLFARRGRITLFDFEDCEYHWFVNDLAVALYFAVEDSFNGTDLRSYVRGFMEALLRGYERHARLDPDWLRRIPSFHGLRDLLTVLYFHAYGGNSQGEDEISRAVRSRINLECDRPYLPEGVLEELF